MLRERSGNGGYLTFLPMMGNEKKVCVLVFQATLGLVKKQVMP